MLPNDFKKLGIRCSTLERLVTQLESRGEPVTHDAEAAARLTDSPNLQLDQSAQKA
jgi:hypothetical protein